MEAIRLNEALTYWTAPHPAWRPNPDWPEEVGFTTWQGQDQFVLIDPLVRDDLVATAWDPFDRAVARSGRSVAVLLTAPWHERSVQDVVARYEGGVWAHPSARSRLAELPELDELPAGVEAFVPAGVNEGQVAFHIVPENTLVVAEFLLGIDGELRVAPSPATEDAGAFAASLDQLRHMSIERVLVAHGPPVLTGGAEAIARALDYFSPQVNR